MWGSQSLTSAVWKAGTSSVLLMTSLYHQCSARSTFRRCFIPSACPKSYQVRAQINGMTRASNAAETSLVGSPNGSVNCVVRASYWGNSKWQLLPTVNLCLFYKLTSIKFLCCEPFYGLQSLRFLIVQHLI